MTKPLSVPPTASGQPSPAEKNVAKFARLVLRALTEMAANSNWRPVDVTTALRRAGLPLDTSRIQPALRLLQTNGCVTDLVPLADGGLLLTVTGHKLGPTRWNSR